MHLLEIIILASFFSAFFLILVFAFLITRHALKKGTQKLKFPKKTIYLFAFFVLLAWGGGVYRSYLSKSEVSDFLSHLDADSQLYVNGSRVDKPQQYFSLLSHLNYDYSAHNSIPKILFDVRITNKNKELNLELYRDSRVLDEYWVFYPKYGKISRKEIAKVTTPLFDTL